MTRYRKWLGSLFGSVRKAWCKGEATGTAHSRYCGEISISDEVPTARKVLLDDA